MKSEQRQRVADYREILPYFLRIFIPLTAFILSAVVIYFAVDTHHEERRIRVEQTQQVELSQLSLQRDISGVINELRYLATSDTLMRFIGSGNGNSDVRAAAERDVARFARNLGRYDQIRWLDLSGMEQLRVDHRDGVTRIVAPEELQDKSKRYYFTDAISLAPGEIYLSPLDLNIEQGGVEIPYRPMLRIATPTADGKGTRNGLLIFNYQASLMLENFARSKQLGPAELSLLNINGYWLYAEDAKREWAFMVGKNERFQNHYPEAWKAISQQLHGSVMTDNGLFAFRAVDALMRLTNGVTTLPQDRYPSQEQTQLRRERWIIVSHYPRQALEELYKEHLALYSALLLLTLSGLGAFSWKMAKTLFERNRLVDRLKLHAKVMEAATNGVMITDSEPKVVAVNRAFTSLTGYSSEEVIGKHPSMLASGRHEETFYQRMWRELNEKGYWEGEIWNRHKSGELFPEWLSISAVPASHGDALHYIGIFSTLSEQKSTEAHLRELANTDPLTGLLNRNLLYDHASQALAQSRRSGDKAAFVFLDLDGFKPINDAMGHAAGDMVLKEVSKRLKACVRESDTVARFGGDEFVVLLTGVTEHAEVAAVAEKILGSINEEFHVSGNHCHVGVSIGVSLYPDDGDTAEALLKHADEAMYLAKETGKGRIKFYSDGT